MKVIDLIIQLQQMPANKEIVVEKGNGKMFCFADIVSVEEIEIDEIGEVVAILPFSMDNEDNSN